MLNHTICNDACMAELIQCRICDIAVQIDKNKKAIMVYCIIIKNKLMQLISTVSAQIIQSKTN